MAARRLLEVESKFVFKPSLVPTFMTNGGSPAFKRLELLGTHKFTDTYFDCQDTLSKNGIWLRQRRKDSSATLEAKVRISGDFARSTFDETTDRSVISGLIRPHLPQFSQEKEHFGLEVLAQFMTTRQDFRADDKFAIVLDYTNFGHSVGEVELMAEDEESAHREIDTFMARYPWFFEKGKTEGKLEAYFRRYAHFPATQKSFYSRFPAFRFGEPEHNVVETEGLTLEVTMFVSRLPAATAAIPVVHFSLLAFQLYHRTGHEYPLDPLASPVYSWKIIDYLTLFKQPLGIRLYSFMAANASAGPMTAEYKQLGKSGLRVSVPILGAMSFGDKRWAPWVIEEDQALPLLKAAYDRGLNTWDTANVYSNGVSEEIIGKAIKKYNLPRHKLVILSKCCGTTREGNDPETLALKDIDQTVDYVNQRGLSRHAIFNAVEASLRRLDTPYIDLFQIHRYDKTVPVEETMEALHDLVKSGKVRYIGASSMWAYQFATMQSTAERRGWTKFISMQNHYSLLYREEEREMNKFCNETGVGLIPWSPLAMGALARPASSHGSTKRSEGKTMGDTDTQIISRVEELAQKHDWKMSQVALAWTNKRISSPIVGFSSVNRIDEALAVRGKVLSEEDEKYLEEPYRPKAIMGHS